MMNKVKPEPIAENRDTCFICSQGKFKQSHYDLVFLKGSNIICKSCGAVHGAIYDEEGYQKMVVKEIRNLDPRHPAQDL